MIFGIITLPYLFRLSKGGEKNEGEVNFLIWEVFSHFLSLSVSGHVQREEKIESTAYIHIIKGLQWDVLFYFFSCQLTGVARPPGRGKLLAFCICMLYLPTITTISYVLSMLVFK